jgi:uncharacterized protein (DUF1684 family)
VGDLDPLTLQDWRRRVFELYAALRAAPDPALGWQRWRTERDALFAHHPATPLAAKARDAFAGLPVYAYDPSARVLADAEPAAERTITLTGSAGATFGARRFATARFSLAGADLGLDLYWLEGYAGGLFVPFADATSGETTYGAGRYLLDTVKGADLGTHDGRLVLDFNFAYNPSCTYDPRWSCPLAPPGNRLTVAITAGEWVA